MIFWPSEPVAVLRLARRCSDRRRMKHLTETAGSGSAASRSRSLRSSVRAWGSGWRSEAPRKTHSRSRRKPKSHRPSRFRAPMRRQPLRKRRSSRRMKRSPPQPSQSRSRPRRSRTTPRRPHPSSRSRRPRSAARAPLSDARERPRARRARRPLLLRRPRSAAVTSMRSWTRSWAVRHRRQSRSKAARPPAGTAPASPTRRLETT